MARFVVQFFKDEVYVTCDKILALVLAYFVVAGLVQLRAKSTELAHCISHNVHFTFGVLYVEIVL